MSSSSSSGGLFWGGGISGLMWWMCPEIFSPLSGQKAEILANVTFCDTRQTDRHSGTLFKINSSRSSTALVVVVQIFYCTSSLYWCHNYPVQRGPEALSPRTAANSDRHTLHIEVLVTRQAVTKREV